MRMWEEPPPFQYSWYKSACDLPLYAMQDLIEKGMDLYKLIGCIDESLGDSIKIIQYWLGRILFKVEASDIKVKQSQVRVIVGTLIALGRYNVLAAKVERVEN